jgi:subfamily B ATP-binding cassette protein HlyB/CyaB
LKSIQQNLTEINNYSNINSEYNPLSIFWYISLFLKAPSLSFQMVLSSILVQLFGLGMPVFYMVIFDRVFGRQNLSALDVIGIGVLLLLVFDLIIKYIRSYVLANLLEKIDCKSVDIISEYLLKRFENKYTLADKKVFSESFLSLFKANQSIVYTFLISSLDVIFSFFALSILMILNLKLALIAIIPLVPIGVLIFLKIPAQKKSSQISNFEQKEYQLNIHEYFENIDTIRSLNAENHFLINISDKIKSFINKEFWARFDRLAAGSDIAFIMNLSSFAILYFGAHEVLEGSISYGIYLAISIMGRNITGGLQRLLVSLQQFQESVIIVQDLKKYITGKNNLQNINGAIITSLKGNISFKDVSYSYNEKNANIVNRISFEISNGQKVVITGKSGAGKSTILKLLNSALILKSGEILIDGFNINDIDNDFLKQSTGILQQKPAAFSCSLMNNISLGCEKCTVEEILMALSFVNFDETLAKLPERLDTQITPFEKILSDGQIAQLALARVLLKNPQILMLDDALAKLDHSTQSIIFSRIFERFKALTCLFVSDFIPLHQKCDKIFVIHDGRLVEQGTYDELTKIRGYYHHLYTAQMILR